jgi:hypothetical protein
VFAAVVVDNNNLVMFGNYTVVDRQDNSFVE